MTEEPTRSGDTARPEPAGTQPAGTQPAGTQPAAIGSAGTGSAEVESPTSDLSTPDEPASGRPQPGEPASDRPEPADEPASDQAGWADTVGFDSVGSGAGGSDAADRPDERPPSGVRAALTGAIGRRRRISAAGAVIGLLLGLLGFALVVQLRSNATDEQLSSERPEDLVRILSDLDAHKDRLSQEISQQQSLAQQLAAGSQSRQAALAEASRRADELGILAGTLAATGPGLRVEFAATPKAIRAADVLDAVEELRGAGAEAMQIDGQNGTAVRIIASTAFVDGSNSTLVVDGQTLAGPYTITVIGDPQTMQIALNIPSGVVDTVQHNGGTVSVVTPGTVQVTALHQNTTPRYAKPVG
jgi:uncharacterized protein YlxW (UPF0749 family)